jgi:crossover junction endonuclease MUS81
LFLDSSSAEAPANIATQSSTSTNTSPIPATPKPRKKRAKTQKEYIPEFQSGPYSILLALRMQLINQSIFDDHFTQKPQLIELAQPHCNVPLDRPLPGSRFTGWSCMRTLTTKELVEKRGKPTKYGLTEEGFELSDKIYKVYCQNENLTYSPFTLNFENDNNNNDENGIGNNSYAPREIDLTSYKIVLVIDNREINTKNTEEFFQKELRKLGVDYCFRQLSVGDFMWIAQPPNGGGPDREVVLDFVVERKLIDDLAASIKDGRYKEQKVSLIFEHII